MTSVFELLLDWIRKKYQKPYGVIQGASQVALCAAPISVVGNYYKGEQVTLDDIHNKTLGEVIDLFRRDLISTEVAKAYCDLWNSYTFRFTEVRVQGNSIIQVNSPDVVWKGYRQ